MFKKLLSSVFGTEPPPQVETFDEARWEEAIRTGREFFDKDKHRHCLL